MSAQTWRLGPPPAPREQIPWWRRRPASRRMRHRVLLARRVLAATLAALAVFSGLRVAFPPARATGIPVLVATSPLPAGARVTGSDVRVVLRPPADVPRGALTDPAQASDRVLAAPVEAGELLTDARVHGAGLLASQPAGRVAVAIALADHAMASILRPGDEVSVLTPGTGATVAHATVLAIQAPEAAAGISLGGSGHLVVAITAAEASAVAAASAGPDVGFVVALHGT